MKRYGKRLAGQTGAVLIISMVCLLFGALVMVPFLNFMTTGLNSGIRSEEKTFEIHAADAGLDDAIQKIKKLAPPLDDLGMLDEYSYEIVSVNNQPLNVTIQRVTLLDGLMGDDEYKAGQPHEGWIQYDLPDDLIIHNPGDGWVEYTAILYFYYDGTGTRSIQSAGAYFAPYPGDIIEGPYDEVTTGAMTLDKLESTEVKIAAGGFSFIYRWMPNQGPVFKPSDPEGSITFKFKVYDPNWSYNSTFVWATIKEQDVSYITTANIGKWLITTSVGDTEVQSQVLRDNGIIRILSWELNPPASAS